jgi:hypothetical protein
MQGIDALTHLQMASVMMHRIGASALKGAPYRSTRIGAYTTKSLFHKEKWLGMFSAKSGALPR